jgi:hypothetical protein
VRAPGPRGLAGDLGDIKPLVDRALASDPTWSDDLLLFMERNGFPEEVYFENWLRSTRCDSEM